MRLNPSGDCFALCYGDWLERVAHLIVQSDAGASFGIYGAWGSGKSSACMALQRQIYANASTAQRIVQCVTIDAYALRRANEKTKDIVVETIAGAITLDDAASNLGLPERNKIYRVIADLIGPSLGQLDATKWAAKPLTELGEAGTRELKRQREERRKRAEAEIDRIIVFVDDIDRCDPDEARTILANINDSLAATEANVIIACDPRVLAAHLAREFGVDATAAMQSVSKYIHVPLWLPTAPVEGHKKALKRYFSVHEIDDIEIQAAVFIALGAVPIRDLLAAIPQALLWLALIERWEEKARGRLTTRGLVRAALLLSLVMSLLPDVTAFGYHERLSAMGIFNPTMRPDQSEFPVILRLVELYRRHVPLDTIRSIFVKDITEDDASAVLFAAAGTPTVSPRLDLPNAR